MSKLIRACIAAQPTKLVLITDSMVQTGHVLASIEDKTIGMTGALSPARFRGADAEFNIGCAKRGEPPYIMNDRARECGPCH